MLYHLKKQSLIFLILVCLFALSGCDEDITTYDYEINFTQDNFYPESNSVSLLQVASDPDELLIAVDMLDISNGPSHGIYFDLIFRDEVMFFDAIQPGDVLEDAGEVYYQAALDPQDPGRVIIGISLVGTRQIDTADGPVAYVLFKPKRQGECPITFENSRIMTSDNGGTIPVTGISWYGGYASVL